MERRERNGDAVLGWSLSSCLEEHLPTDCSVATMLPAATPPPLAMAAADIILAAMDAAAIPVPVKPMADRATGAAATATAVGRGVGWCGLRGKTHSRIPGVFWGSFYSKQQGKGSKGKGG